MNTSLAVREEMGFCNNWPLESDNLTKPNRALIVEDDLALKPLWEKAFRSRGGRIWFDWVSTGEEAEKLMRFRYRNNNPYDMVIADIFLAGQQTGVDLWNRYGEETLNFIFVSSLPAGKFNQLMNLNFSCPLYKRKPLTFNTCTQIVDLIYDSVG